MLFLQGILPWIQIVLSLLLITAILLQQSEAGLGSAFGGSNPSSNFHTKRGLEKTLFLGSVVLAVLFLLVAILQLFLNV